MTNENVLQVQAIVQKEAQKRKMTSEKVQIVLIFLLSRSIMI